MVIKKRLVSILAIFQRKKDGYTLSVRCLRTFKAHKKFKADFFIIQKSSVSCPKQIQLYYTSRQI
jgi:hypothetical protein